MKIAAITVGPFAMNCYLVYDELSRTGVVIDPGDEIARIQKAIEQRELSVTHILLTHGHIDHVAYAEDLHIALKVPMLLHVADHQMARDVQRQASMFGLPPCPQPQIDGELREGDIIVSGPLAFSVVHTPGHSPGSVSLLLAGAAFCGDVVFQGSIGRTDLPGGDMQILLQSIESRILCLADDTQLFPGHGPPTSVGAERRTNPFLRELH